MLLANLKIAATIIVRLSSILTKSNEKAEASKAALQASGRFTDPIVTTIEPAQPFYLAEEEHQEYYKRILKILLAIMPVEQPFRRSLGARTCVKVFIAI